MCNSDSNRGTGKPLTKYNCTENAYSHELDLNNERDSFLRYCRILYGNLKAKQAQSVWISFFYTFMQPSSLLINEGISNFKIPVHPNVRNVECNFNLEKEIEFTNDRVTICINVNLSDSRSSEY